MIEDPSSFTTPTFQIGYPNTKISMVAAAGTFQVQSDIQIIKFGLRNWPSENGYAKYSVDIWKAVPMVVAMTYYGGTGQAFSRLSIECPTWSDESVATVTLGDEELPLVRAFAEMPEMLQRRASGIGRFDNLKVRTVFWRRAVVPLRLRRSFCLYRGRSAPASTVLFEGHEYCEQKSVDLILQLTAACTCMQVACSLSACRLIRFHCNLCRLLCQGCSVSTTAAGKQCPCAAYKATVGSSGVGGGSLWRQS